MRVQQERRANQEQQPTQNIEGYTVKVYRPNRGKHHLDPWGALERRCCGYRKRRNWKHYRKIQYYTNGAKNGRIQ